MFRNRIKNIDDMNKIIFNSQIILTLICQAREFKFFDFTVNPLVSIIN